MKTARLWELMEQRHAALDRGDFAEAKRLSAVIDLHIEEIGQ